MAYIRMRPASNCVNTDYDSTSNLWGVIVAGAAQRGVPGSPWMYSVGLSGWEMALSGFLGLAVEAVEVETTGLIL